MKNRLNHHPIYFNLPALNHRATYQDHFIHHHQTMIHHFRFLYFLVLIHPNHPF